MDSDILAELRRLSFKVDTLQSEISQLYKVLHLCHCHGTTKQRSDNCRNDANQSDRLLCNSNLFEIDGCSNKCQKSPAEILPLPKQKTNRPSYRTEENCSPQAPNLPTKKHHIQERIRQNSYRSFKECKEECLRKALQQNIVLLVDSIPYSENDILDKLIENECMTETECSDLRNNGSRKDCVRNLVRTIKGRSYKVIKTFVDCVKTLHPEVAASIWQVYEKLIKDKRNYQRQCTFCVLKRSTDIKFIADHTWSTGAVSDELYDEIVDGRYGRETLWSKLADEFNKTDVSIRQNILRNISEALMIKGQYRELVLKLRKVSVLRCICPTGDVDSGKLSAFDISVPKIVFSDFDENSTVSPLSTPESSWSVADDNESVLDDDDFPANKHENYFLSPRTAENDLVLYKSYFGLRKGSLFVHGVIGEEFRKSRSNSFGKNTAQHGNKPLHAKRRASMFM